MISKQELLYKLRHKTLTINEVQEYSELFKFEHDYLSRPHVLTEDVYEDTIFVTGVATTLMNRKRKGNILAPPI